MSDGKLESGGIKKQTAEEPVTPQAHSQETQETKACVEAVMAAEKKLEKLVDIPKSFPNADQNAVLTELIQQNAHWSILYNLPRLSHIDTDAAVQTLLGEHDEHRYAISLLGSLAEPDGINPVRLQPSTLARIMKFVPAHHVQETIKNLVDKMPRVDNVVACAIAKNISSEVIAQNLAKVEHPDSKLAVALASSQPKELLANIEMFDDPGPEAARWLMLSIEMREVFANLHRFKGVNPNDVARIAIENGAAWYAFRGMKEIDLNEIVPAMIKQGVTIKEIGETYDIRDLDSNRLFTFLSGRKDVANMRVFLENEGVKIPDEAIMRSVIQNDLILNRNISGFNQFAPKIPLEQAFRISLDYYDDNNYEPIRNALDEFARAPRLSEHFTLNPRYAPRLFKALTYLDEPSRENIRLLHQLSLPKDSVTIFSDDIRKNQIDSQRDYKNNLQIISEIRESGIPVEKWLGHNEQQSFVLQRGEELPLTTLKCPTPIDRVLAVSIPEFHARTLSFIRSLPDELLNSPIPERDDEKLSTLKQKKDMIERAIDSAEKSDDKQTREGIPGMKKGLAGLQLALEKYRAPKIRDVFQGRIDASLVSKKDLGQKIAERDDLIKIHKARPERKTLSRLKQLDKTIAEGIISLLDRTQEAILLISHVVLDKDILAKYSDTTAMLKDHMEEDRHAISEAFSEKSEGGTLNGREITIGVSDRNPYTALYIGNQTDCCVRIDSDDVHGDRSPISDYLTDLGMQIVVAADTTDPNKPVPVAAAWCYIGIAEGKPVLMIDNIEAETKYTDQYKVQFEPAMKSYLESFARTLNIPLLQGKWNNDLEVAPLTGIRKLGGYNRADGYYLEGEVLDIKENGEIIMAN